jgi:aspartyl-tRNA(Asn)/glutamyl-tRNA(Gln) amidotransferase subunit C
MDIEHVVLLARLKLTESEKEFFPGQVERIISYMDQLNELDTSNVEPTAHILPLKNVFREDNITASLPQDNAMQNAPKRDGSLYRVPKIIE